jgi:DNA-binding transcriptional LysR family regulator
MNLKHLQLAKAVADLSSFGQAASTCNVTQPTLSAAIAQLEKQFGASLFERTTRTVALSPFGKHLLPMIEQILAAHVELSRSAASYLSPDVKMVRIGVSPIIDMAKVVHALAPFVKRHPQVEIHYKECFLDDLEARLAAETIDLAVRPLAGSKKRGAQNVLLYRDPWVFLPSGGGLPTASKTITLDEAAGGNLILTAGHCGLAQATRQLFDSVSLRLNEYPGKPISYSAVQEWTDLGIGSGLLPASKVNSDHTRSFSPLVDSNGKACHLDIFLSWKAPAPDRPHLRALKKHLQSAMK